MKTLDEGGIVLPETLVAEFIDQISSRAMDIGNDFQRLTRDRDAIRSRLIEKNGIQEFRADPNNIADVLTVDGAQTIEDDKANTYSISCAVRVGPDQNWANQDVCVATLPHITSISSISIGLMFMQEIMMAVETAEKYPDHIVLIDGSRVSAIIKINQFYASVLQEMSEKLDQWRQDAMGVGKVLCRFESRDWLRDFLSLPNIAGNLKLVTTDLIVRRFAPDWEGRIDDKTVATLVLKNGEHIRPVKLSPPCEPSGAVKDPPYHINRLFPFQEDFVRYVKMLFDNKSTMRLYHLYYMPGYSDVVSKIEFNRGFLENFGKRGLLGWYENETVSPDIYEPYYCHIADRFAKEGVSVSTRALMDIIRQKAGADWGWYLTGKYRT